MTHISRRAALKSSAAISLLTSFGCERDAPSTTDDLANLDAVSTAQAVKSGNVSALEVVNAAIGRAEKINPAINAIVTPYYDTAREQAAVTPAGAWFGVPTFIKDLNNVIGQRTTYGSRAFANYVATEQSAHIDAIFANGLVSLGKSATPEFGLTATTEPMLSGATRNPWNTNHSTGGSSGGAAALVAARVTPVAHASDGGGSIRIPASCCGLVGLKPSRARMPVPDGDAGAPVNLTAHGVESRTVRDTAAYIAMMEVDNDLPQIGLVSGPVSARKKVAFFTKAPTGIAVDPEVVSVTEATARQLESLGHEVEEIEPPFDSSVLQDFSIYWAARIALVVENWERVSGQKAGYNAFEPFTYGLIEYYEGRRDLLETVVARLISFERDYRAAFSNFDLLLSPVLATPPPEIGYLSTTYGFDLILERISEYVAFTQVANVAGAPAISLPIGMSSSGLPIGAQLAAVPGNERAILEVAYELEEEFEWSKRAPALL